MSITKYPEAECEQKERTKKKIKMSSGALQNFAYFYALSAVSFYGKMSKKERKGNKEWERERKRA